MTTKTLERLAPLALVALFLIASALPGSVRAECACLCTHTGEWRTFCTAVDLASQDPAVCGAKAPGSCPAASLTDFGDLSPIANGPDGSTNCRWMGIWRPASQSFQPWKVCDPEQSPIDAGAHPYRLQAPSPYR